MPRTILVLAVLATALVAPAPAGGVPHPQAPGCAIFPDNNVWHSKVAGLPVHRRSKQWIRAMGGRSQLLHPDFGPSDDPDHPYGIAYNVVDGAHERHAVTFSYPDESDPGPYPVGPATHVEHGSDRHALVVEKDACVLYEIFDFDWNGGDPQGGSGAVWDLGSNALRPRTWTSADAAGLPIFAGLIRRDEVEAGVIDHAIRVTAEETDRKFVWPARHQAGARRDPKLPPMGARFRLKKGFPMAGFHPETRVILRAMKRYGVIVADNGSNWFFGGAEDQGWTSEVLDEMKSIRAGAFVAVATGRLKVSADSAAVKPKYVGIP
ncbi:MAG: hypothetical protein ACRDKA_00615 [Actinomycetota bacterium]